ncbi:MAG: FAD-dependent monooxygenase [Chitinivibrionales bacterium]|nr:FAD-dependent monooxygenase [Chitinivibrionales bacterium]
MGKADIIVIGAGPIGLLSSILAAQQGFSVIILEKNGSRIKQSRAIGITPPSLGIFERCSLVQQFIDQGVAVSHSAGYSSRGLLGEVDFSELKTKTSYPFVLAIPQRATESILESSLQVYTNIRYLQGHEVFKVIQHGKQFSVEGKAVQNQDFSYTATIVICCDGAQSKIRQSSGIDFPVYQYPHTFLMGDFADTSGWGHQARLYFTAHGSVESFPLPAGQRRYVLRTPTRIEEYATDYLITEIPRRCGITVTKSEQFWESGFGVQRCLASQFAIPGIFLCGDAAHLMSPIGGQNMNCGFADAELAVWLADLLLKEKVSAEKAARVYTQFRRRAVRAAQLRAEIMMRCGTSCGFLWNEIRNLGTRIVLGTHLRSLLYGMFTMLTIPNRDLASSVVRLKRTLDL